MADKMYAFVVPGKYLEKMIKIRQESGIPITKQIRIRIEDFIFRYKKSKSPFMKSLREYKRPKIGEIIKTDYGYTEVLDVKFYDKVIEEMKDNGFSDEEIDQFTYRVEHFLGKKEKYFECDIQYGDGEVESIDWSEYLALKKKKEMILRPNTKT